MNSDQSNLFNSSAKSIAPLACHQEYQHWQQIIWQQEEEIRQLRTLLLDVVNQCSCRTLNHDAIDYCRDLEKLQSKFDHLHHNFICTGAHCGPITEKLDCTDERFGLSATVERHATLLVTEFSRIKDGCLRFFSSMMSLNML